MKSNEQSKTTANRQTPWTRMLLALALLLYIGSVARAAEEPPPAAGGELRILGPEGADSGACPLEHTEVEADVAGFVARVRVRQRFQNPLPRKIEAVYVFPLPRDAAVDGMTMTVGDRRVVGKIEPRDAARRIYEAARAAGHVTGLLDQERPNIFTQSVANIEPGVAVTIEISYVETLRYEDGLFEFVFPMVVGPRYMPGTPVGKQGAGWAPDTDQVPDASRISPPVTPPGTRAGHDISVTVDIDAGSELFDVDSASHRVKVRDRGAGRVRVVLADEAEIPNKDFILHYRTATRRIGDAFLVHEDQRGKYFTLILQPPRRVAPREAVPKEMIFVIDRSGSMSGFPIEKAKEVMRLAIEGMNPRDTFNLLSFSGGTGRCFAEPVANTPQNRAVALRYLADLYGSGGTEMMTAIKSALEGQKDPERVRVVAFMTDGYIGNDFEIIDAVEKNAGTARVFAFGIGGSVNRFLLDGMAHAGRGDVEYVTLESQAAGAIDRFRKRIHSPVLTDIAIDWGTLPVADVYPKLVPDLFSSKPMMIHGRLTGEPSGTITLSGHTADGRFERDIDVGPSAVTSTHEALASLWARAAVADLMMRDLAALQRNDFPEEIRKEITTLGVDFHLMTQFTSFVAVEEMTVTVGGEPTTIAVPVEMPEGVSYEGVFGNEGRAKLAAGPAMAGQGFLMQAAPSVVARSSVAAPREGYAFDAVKEQEGRDVEAKPVPVEIKLAESLRGLAKKVAKEGKDGNLTVGKLRIVGHRVDVMVHLADTSAQTLKALEKIGFKQTGESKTAPILIGTIDVRRLNELAALQSVVRIEPVLV